VLAEDGMAVSVTSTINHMYTQVSFSPFIQALEHNEIILSSFYYFINKRNAILE